MQTRHTSDTHMGNLFVLCAETYGHSISQTGTWRVAAVTPPLFLPREKYVESYFPDVVRDDGADWCTRNHTNTVLTVRVIIVLEMPRPFSNTE